MYLVPEDGAGGQLCPSPGTPRSGHSVPPLVPPLCGDGGTLERAGGFELPHAVRAPSTGSVGAGLQVGALFSSQEKKRNQGTASTGAGGGLLSQTSQLYTKVCSRICTAVNNYNWFL